MNEFSPPQNPPLKRLLLWCDYVRDVQKNVTKNTSTSAAAPTPAVGGELATQDRKIRLKAKDLVGRHVKYLTSAIADAMLAGDVEPGDAGVKAQLAHACVIGLLLRAKIYNDLKFLQHADAAVFALIGAKISKQRSGE